MTAATQVCAAAIATLIAAGCQSPAAQEHPADRVWQSREALERSPPLQTETVLTIGDSTAGDIRFTRIFDLAVDSAGSIYTTESYIEACARVFDATGRFVQNLGGHGSGPGECTGGSAIAVSRDSVFIHDRGGLLVFSNGRYMRSIPAGSVLSKVEKLRYTDAGLMGVTSSIETRDNRVTVHVRPIDAETAEAGPPVVSLPLQRMYPISSGGASAAPLSATPTVAITQGGDALFTQADSFAIDAVSADGVRRTVAAFDVPRVPATGAHFEAAYRSIALSLSQRP